MPLNSGLTNNAVFSSSSVFTGKASSALTANALLTNNNAARYVCDISKVLPGDILLSRIPMDLENESTWDSHLIRVLTRSSFSFAALCVVDGLFIEAVGSGVARLPLWKAGIRDARNIRILRPRQDYRWAAIRAAACGLNYLERGFYQAGMPKPKCTAFQDVRRAAATNSNIVVNAYLEAGLTVDLLKRVDSNSTDSIFAGDLVESALFEDITHHVLKPLSLPMRAVFNLDDETLRQRIHHWEVETQLKVLCKYEVRRILELKSEKPNSLADLETLIANNQWRSLDSALHHSLQWYRYDKLYQLKQNQLLDDISVWNPPFSMSLRCDDHETAPEAVSVDEQEVFDFVEMEANYCRKQRDRYKDLISSYQCASFYYMHDLFSDQEIKLRKIVNGLNGNKKDDVLVDEFIADCVYKNSHVYNDGYKKDKYERHTHKKYCEIN